MASAQERLRIAASAHHRRRIILLGDSGPVPSSLTSTLTSPATEVLIDSAGVVVTFNARDVNNMVVVGYTPQPSSGVV